jgi:lipopolysaccharide biosynthesis glycosyltransferase
METVVCRIASGRSISVPRTYNLERVLNLLSNDMPAAEEDVIMISVTGKKPWTAITTDSQFRRILEDSDVHYLYFRIAEEDEWKSDAEDYEIDTKIFESQHTAKAQDPSSSETTTGIISPATTGTRGGARGGRGGRGGSRGNVNGRGGRGGKGKDVASAEISVRRSGRKAKPSEKIIYEADTAQEKADKETIQRARRRRQHEEKELLTSFPYD